MTNEHDDIRPEDTTDETRATIGWGRWIAVGAVAAMLVGGAGIASAISDDSGPGFMRGGFGERMGPPRGFMRAGFGGHGIGHVLNEIDVTDEQEDKIFEILDGARGEVRPMFREFRDTREELTELLSAETIDRQAVETLRAERVATLDETSKKMVEAMLNAAEVLTPEQRAELAKHFEERGMRGRW